MTQKEAQEHIDYITKFVVDNWGDSEMTLKWAAEKMERYIKSKPDLQEFHMAIIGHLAVHFHTEYLKSDVNKLLSRLREVQ